MRVWVVHTEWERSCDGSNSVVEGVFMTEAAARQAAFDTIDEYKEMGNAPYFDEREDEDGDSDWDFDVHVEECEVQE